MNASLGSIGQKLGLSILAFAALLFALPVGNAAAEESSELKSALKNLDWGDSKSEVLEGLKKQKLGKLRERKDLRHDRVKMQRARKRAIEDFNRIKDSYTELKGDLTRYKVSVIADEFTKNNNEALLKIDDKVAQRFFFFADGSLYKMVVAYKQNYLDGVGFESFVGKVSNKYGRPDETNYGKVDGEKTLLDAVWTQGRTRLRAKNQKEFFGTYSMVFADKSRIDRMASKDKSFGGSDKDKAQISNRVESLKKDSGTDANEKIVDGMVGEDVEVDLSHGDKDLDEQGPTANRDDKEGGSSDKVADKSGGSSGESSAQKKKKEEKEESKRSKRDFSDVGSTKDENKDDDELIVY